MITKGSCLTKSCFRWLTMARFCSSSKTVTGPNDPTKKICKLMISCPKSGIATVLDQSGVRISQDVVEKVLARFENAGMLAHQFFDWAGKQRGYKHSVRAYHTVIESLAKIRQYQIMWDLVNNMGSKAMLNIETFCIIMRRYSRCQKVEEAVYTFNVMEKYNINPNLAAFNGLLSALCKSKNVRRAQEIFDSMKGRFSPNSKTYSILLDGWGREPNLPMAREIYREMVKVGIEPDIVTYGIMVDILCKGGRVDEAIEIVKDMESSGCKPTSFIYSVLIHTYGIENRIEDAIDTFLEMENNGVSTDVALYNALICGFCKVNKLKNVYMVLDEMEYKGVIPNSRTCNIILRSLIDRGESDEAFKVFRRMIKICDPDSDTYTLMIKMFCERNEIENALKVWKYMKKKRFLPSMHTFCALIDGLCDKKADAQRACILMDEMIEKGIRPSRMTFQKLRIWLIREQRQDILKFLELKLDLLVKEPLCD